jgi:hypothetical protein
MLAVVASESAVDGGMGLEARAALATWARRLTPLAWLFVVLAAADLVLRLLWLPGPAELTTTLAGIAHAAAHALIVLLPAAVLSAEPRAWRKARPIILGVLTLAGTELVSLAAQVYRASLVAPDTAAAERLPGETLGDLLRFALAIGALAGPVLLAVGLAWLLRGRLGVPALRPTPTRLTILALGAAVAGIELLQVLGERGPVHRLDVVCGAVYALVVVAWAGLAAVAIPPASDVGPGRRGRLLLATGALAFVAASALSLVNTFVLDGSIAISAGFFLLSPLLGTIGVALLVAGLAARPQGPEAALVEAA